MQHMILIQANAATTAMFARLDPEQRQAAFQRYWDIQAELEASGELVDAKAIEPTGQRLVRRSADGVTVDEAEAGGEALSGYYLVDVVDEARAIEIAAGFPEAEADGGIRVARVWTADDFAAMDG